MPLAFIQLSVVHLKISDIEYSLASIIISINLQSMSHLSMGLHDTHNTPVQPEKRRRVPSSKYIEGIKELRKTVNRQPKKQRQQQTFEEQDLENKISESRGYQQRDFCLPCLLPNGRKLKLSIMIKKGPRKLKKKVSVVTPPKKIEKEQVKGSLLDIFMMACEKIDKNLDVRNGYSNGHKQDQQMSQNISNQGYKKMESKYRRQKQDEDKYNKFYEKYLLLNQKLQTQDEKIVLL